MNGWIKLEKVLLAHPRLTATVDKMMCRHDEAEPVTDGHTLRHALTVTLGALAQLWLLADSHLGEDDVLPFGIDEINQFIGIPKFCEILPQQWLQVLDADHVKLPGYHEHNGTQAKRRANDAERQRRHRDKQRKPPVTACHETSRVSALPDQTRPDLLNQNKPVRAPKKIGARLPQDWNLTPERIAVAQQHGLDAARVCEYFRNYWHAKAGRDACKLDWDLTWRNWCATEAQRKPSVTVNGATPDHSAEWREAKARAAAIGFRAPWPQESAAAYMTQVKFTETLPFAQSILKRIEAQRS